MTCLIQTREFAPYSLGEPSPATWTCPLPFSSACYSRYKYGSVTSAEAFAQALGTAFAERHPELACAPGLLMTSSLYTYVPTAAIVKGHQELPGDGHEICPLVATRSARRRPPDGLRGQVLRGITPFPARAWDRRMLSPAVWQTCA